jgi:enterochelin esterase-like enzyme
MPRLYFIYVFSILVTQHSISQTTAAKQQILPSSSGTIVRLQDFPSSFVSSRNIDVWLPSVYDPSVPCSVLYMHDGQMLYDSTTTWNHQAWDVDDTADRCIRERKINPVIIVGIWNADMKRHEEYLPEKVFRALSQEQQQTMKNQFKEAGRAQMDYTPAADNYLRFLCLELKPYIDSAFSVKKDARHTFIAGSSMGGLISWYAVTEYPDIFGGAACLSTHWPGSFTMDQNPFPEAFGKYLYDHLPSPGTHKFYFDCGDQTLDELYPPLQKEIDKIAQNRGFTAANWKSLYFPGADHSEKAWKARMEMIFIYLFGTN